MSFTARLDLRALQAVSLHASTEDARYYLRGVQLEIEARAVTYIATNGHHMMVHRDELPADAVENTMIGSFLIPVDKCKPFKIARRDSGIAILSTAKLMPHGTECTIAMDGQSTTFKEVDGTFPDWRRVMSAPTAGEAKVVTYNWNYMAVFSKSAKVLNEGANSLGLNPALQPGDGSSPAFVWFNSDHTFGVIMPMRNDRAASDAAPAWTVARPLPTVEMEASAPRAPRAVRRARAPIDPELCDAA